MVCSSIDDLWLDMRRKREREREIEKTSVSDEDNALCIREKEMRVSKIDAYAIQLSIVRHEFDCTVLSYGNKIAH